MPVTDVIIDKGATATAKGGMVFNVKAYGALGTALTSSAQDDTAAFQAAITAASQAMGTLGESSSSARGSVVFVPHGIYRIKGTLTFPNGVALQGAGMHTTQLRFALAPTADGLVWANATELTFGFGGFMEDIDVIAEGAHDSQAQTAANLVVLSWWSNFAFNRVRLQGARDANLRIDNCLHITATHLLARGARTSNLWIGAASNWVTTTCRFVGCYFQASTHGPGADVAGLGLHFDNCVFEDSGNVVPTSGYGIRIRRGTVTLTAPYFEANRSWDLIAGTDVIAPNNANGASVTVINAVVMPYHDEQGVLQKQANTGALRFERGSAFVLGGNYAQSPRPLVVTTSMDMVQAAANFYPHAPEVEGGTFANLPGTVLYKKGSGQVVQAGNVVYGINP
jgi:hypothetical protein